MRTMLSLLLVCFLSTFALCGEEPLPLPELASPELVGSECCFEVPVCRPLCCKPARRVRVRKVTRVRVVERNRKVFARRACCS